MSIQSGKVRQKCGREMWKVKKIGQFVNKKERCVQDRRDFKDGNRNGRDGSRPYKPKQILQNNTKPVAFHVWEGHGSFACYREKIRGIHTPAGTAVSMDGAPPARSSAVTGAGASAGWFSRSRATASISLMRFSWLTRVALGS